MELLWTSYGVKGKERGFERRVKRRLNLAGDTSHVTVRVAKRRMFLEVGTKLELGIAKGNHHRSQCL